MMEHKRNFIILNSNSAIALHSTVEKKILSFSSFEKGWHFGQGVSFQQEVIDKAVELVKFLEINSLINLNAFPGIHGEIQITAYPENGRFLEVTIDSPNDITLSIEDENERELFGQQCGGIEEVKQTILREKSLLLEPKSFSQWITSGSLALSTTSIQERVDLQVSPFDLQGYQSYNISVPSAHQAMPAGIHGLSTHQ